MLLVLSLPLEKNADPSMIGKRVLVDTITRDWDDPMNYNRTDYMGSAFDGGFAGLYGCGSAQCSCHRL